MHTNRERAAALSRAERRVQEREKWLEGEQQELDQTRDRVGFHRILSVYLYDVYVCVGLCLCRRLLFGSGEHSCSPAIQAMQRM